uniref:Uncharacterized protein n=1 Tax=Glossina brevipalpis TaxID=37001 RepID=A0A1A9WJR7_9MUSC
MAPRIELDVQQFTLSLVSCATPLTPFFLESGDVSHKTQYGNKGSGRKHFIFILKSLQLHSNWSFYRNNTINDPRFALANLALGGDKASPLRIISHRLSKIPQKDKKKKVLNSGFYFSKIQKNANNSKICNVAKLNSATADDVYESGSHQAQLGQ